MKTHKTTKMKTYKIFVYGTLLNRNTRNIVCGGNIPLTPTILKGFYKQRLNIIEKKGTSVNGGIMEVNEIQKKSLDAYEGLGHLYKCITVTIKGEEFIAYQLIIKGYL